MTNKPHKITPALAATSFAWPEEMLDERVAIVGTSGSGKTYAAKGLAERLIKTGARVCIVDLLGHWWGLRAGIDGDPAGGLPVTIFGGDHADIAITEHDAGTIGRVIATSDIRCIIDLSEFESDASRRRFMLHFTEALYNANRMTLNLLVDEADFYAPQNAKGEDGPGPALLGKMSQIVRRGRGRGFIPWLITQRPAVLNKNVLSQAKVLVAMQLTASQDRDALGAWIEGQADRDDARRVLAEMPRLTKGVGFIWAPTHGILERVHFPENITFDSSRTPERGETISEASLAPIDAAAIAETLRRERAPAKATAATNCSGVDLDAVRAEGYQAGFADGTRDVAALRDQIEEIQSRAIVAMGQLEEFVDWLADRGPPKIDGHRGPKQVAIEARATEPAVTEAKPSPAKFSQPRNGSAPSGGNGTTKRGAEMRILRVLAQRHPARLTVAQWATLAGMKRTGGTWGTYVSRLRTAGYLDEQRGLVSVTRAGLAAADVRTERASTPAEIRAMWKKAVGGAGRLIDILDTARSGMSRAGLAAAAQMTAAGGTFGTYLSRLRSNGLIVEGGGTIRLVEELR